MLLMMKRSISIFIKSTPTASIVPALLLFYIGRSRWMGDLGFEGQRVTTPNLQFVQEQVFYI